MQSLPRIRPGGTADVQKGTTDLATAPTTLASMELIYNLFTFTRKASIKIDIFWTRLYPVVHPILIKFAFTRNFQCAFVIWCSYPAPRPLFLLSTFWVWCVVLLSRTVLKISI